MSKFKEKAPPFIFGLVFGLLVAGGFFILKLDDYFKELNVYKNFAETFNGEEERVSDESENAETSIMTATTKESNENSNRKKKNEKVSENASKTIDSEVANDMSADSIRITENIVNDEMQIKKDELILVKTLNLIYLNATAKPSSKDSLLEKVSGIDLDNANAVKMMSVEFWQSPLNFKGYKMSKYKMVLFGLKWIEGIKIYKMDDAIFLKAENSVYQFDYTNEFKGYKQVTDAAIINKLK